ncbi:MAG: FkbM family methyltransferase [Candidatus Kapabacteria bacterium]|nr:FkbM family methyltransferase [Ignavibacteriota bacterium]MCW5884680.1 FkbM family methyltransferase [Candidatus Kapabacteria bacterium]
MTLKRNFKLALKKTFPRPVYKYLERKNKYLGERNKILNFLEVDVLFDVGANVGLYGHSVRHHGFRGKILSFEPQKNAFDKLKDLSSGDGLWSVFNYGLGSENSSAKINISANSVSSSILKSGSNLQDICPDADYIGTETIEIKRLDEVAAEICKPEDNFFVKVDTQGFELQVVQGAGKVLDQIVGFQLEMSLIELYQGEKTILEIINYMDEIGYRIATIEPGWNDPKTGFAMQLDGIFVKK